MANPEHVEIVKQGNSVLREWQKANPDQLLDLSGASLSGAELQHEWLENADLSNADLSGAALYEAHVPRANLTGANLEGANLVRLRAFETSFKAARFSSAELTHANIQYSDLEDAKLIGAQLGGADLGWGTLKNADLSGAKIRGTRLVSVDLSGTDISSASLGATVFSGIDFSDLVGLSACIHEGPSRVDIDSLIATFRGAGNKLTGELRDFFHAAGVPPAIIRELPRLVAEVTYYSAFISYGDPDKDFANRLYQDLLGRGVSCWLYEMDSTVGKRSWEEIGAERRNADKMVVLCSHRALVRDGMLKEIEEQIDEDPEKLIPISLDDDWKHSGFKVLRAGHDLKPFLLNRNYADFANLSYEAALERLSAGLTRPTS